MFITFEGIEGSGKTIQIQRVETFLIRRGIPCLVTREPGGTELGGALRNVLLQKGGPPREPLSELLIYLADRHQHLKEIILPALRRGVTVLSDRYHDATRAYQGAARGVPLGVIDTLARVLEIPEPDGTILLDLEPEVGLARARGRNESNPSAIDQGRFEAEDLAFHSAVREAYLDLARRWPRRIRVVQATGKADDVFAQIEPLLVEWIGVIRSGG